MKAWSVIPLLALSSSAFAQNDNPLAIDVGTILLVLIGICVVVAVGVVFWVHHHKTLAEQELEALRAKFDEHVKLKEPTGAPLTLAIHVDATQFHEEMDKVLAALDNFKRSAAQVVNSASGDLESAFKKIMQTKFDVDEKMPGRLMPMEKAPPTKILGPVYIDRDDLMKAIGNDLLQSVTLDGKPVHNGVGPVLSYWTWPDGQGVHNRPQPDQERPPQPKIAGGGGSTAGGTTTIGGTGEGT